MRLDDRFMEDEPKCFTCGACVVDQKLHNDWHNDMEKETEKRGEYEKHKTEQAGSAGETEKTARRPNCF